MTKIERESINFKLPKTLCDALRHAAAERNTTATDLVIQGLHHVLGDVPGVEVSTEIRLRQVEKDILSLALRSDEQSGDPFVQGEAYRTPNTHNERVTLVEQKLVALSDRVSKFEGALTAIQNNLSASSNRRRYKSSVNPYNQSGRPPQIQPLDEQKLALRLNVNIPTLQEKRTTLSPQEFAQWSQSRDSSQYMWRFNEKDELYHPVK